LHPPRAISKVCHESGLRAEVARSAWERALDSLYTGLLAGAPLQTFRRHYLKVKRMAGPRAAPFFAAGRHFDPLRAAGRARNGRWAHTQWNEFLISILGGPAPLVIVDPKEVPPWRNSAECHVFDAIGSGNQTFVTPPPLFSRNRNYRFPLSREAVSCSSKHLKMADFFFLPCLRVFFSDLTEIVSRGTIDPAHADRPGLALARPPSAFESSSNSTIFQTVAALIIRRDGTAKPLKPGRAGLNWTSRSGPPAWSSRGLTESHSPSAARITTRVPPREIGKKNFQEGTWRLRDRVWHNDPAPTAPANIFAGPGHRCHGTRTSKPIWAAAGIPKNHPQEKRLKRSSGFGNEQPDFSPPCARCLRGAKSKITTAGCYSACARRPAASSAHTCKAAKGYEQDFWKNFRIVCALRPPC